MNAIILQSFFAVFNFVVVAALIYKFAGPKVAEGLRERNERNRRLIEEAEAAQAKAEAELASFRARLSNVDTELTAIVTQARSLAVQTAEGIVAGAEADAERLRQAGANEIERERTIARQVIQQTLLARALEAAKAELRAHMNPEIQRQMVVRFIQKVGDGSCPITL